MAVQVLGYFMALEVLRCSSDTKNIPSHDSLVTGMNTQLTCNPKAWDDDRHCIGLK